MSFGYHIVPQVGSLGIVNIPYKMMGAIKRGCYAYGSIWVNELEKCFRCNL